MAFRQTMKAGRKHGKKSRRASKRSRRYSRRASRKSRRGKMGSVSFPFTHSKPPDSLLQACTRILEGYKR